MKVQFISATFRSGISRKKDPNGREYRICNLTYATPLEPVSKAEMTYYGHGGDIREIELDPNCMPSFEGMKVGEFIEPIFSPNPKNPRLNMVVGVKPAKSV